MLYFLLPGSLLYLLHVNNTTSMGNRKGLLLLLVFWHFGWTNVSYFGLDILKIHLASWYLSGGLIKVAISLYLQKSWVTGTTFQSVVLEGMISRPAFDLVTRWTQHHAFCSEFVSKAGSYSGIFLFEGLLCVLAFLDARASVLYGVVMLSFHYGVHLLQGINFVDFHSLGALVFVLASTPGSVERVWRRSEECLTIEPDLSWDDTCFGDTMALLFLFAQVLYAATIGDITLHLLGVERSFYPLTCCPMFSVPLDCWDPAEPFAYTLTDSNLRNQDQPDYLQWCYSVTRKAEGQWSNHLKDEDLLKFPMRVLQFALTGDQCSHPYADSLSDQYRGKGLLLIKANFRVSEQLLQLLEAFGKCLKCTGKTDPWDLQRCDEIIQLNDKIQLLISENAPKMEESEKPFSKILQLPYSALRSDRVSDAGDFRRTQGPSGGRKSQDLPVSTSVF